MATAIFDARDLPDAVQVDGGIWAMPKVGND